MTVSWAVIALLLAAVLAACSVTEPPSATAQATASPEAGSRAGDCAPFDLLTPGGTRVDLTGTWSGASALLFVHQYGECVWIEELSADPRDTLGGAYRRVFFGRLASDFTISGRFADIHSEGVPALFGFEIPPEGETDYQVDIRQADGGDVIVLVGHTRESTEAGFFPLVEYTRIDTGTTFPD